MATEIARMPASRSLGRANRNRGNLSQDNRSRVKDNRATVNRAKRSRVSRNRVKVRLNKVRARAVLRTEPSLAQAKCRLANRTARQPAALEIGAGPVQCIRTTGWIKAIANRCAI